MDHNLTQSSIGSIDFSKYEQNPLDTQSGGYSQMSSYSYQPYQPCPHCGYCAHCGRGGYHTYHYYTYPWYVQPYTIWCGSSGGGVSSAGNSIPFSNENISYTGKM